MTKPRILIVTYNWPPRNAIGTHRPYSWAKYWSAAGAQVTVLTAAKRAFDAPLDLDLPDLDGVGVIEVPYGGAGLSLLDRLVRHPKIRTHLKRIKSWLPRSPSLPADPRLGWRESAAPLAAELSKESDFVVSTFGPNASHLIAYDAKRVNPGLIWVADYRDLWSQTPAIELPDKVRASIRSQEEASVGLHADLVTAVSADMIEKLGEFCKGRRILVPNGFDLDREELNEIFNKASGRCGKPLRIVHTGTVYPGQRDPAPLLENLAGMVDRGELKYGEVTVDFYGSRVELIVQLMDNPRFRPFLRVPGHVSRNDAIKIQQEADLLLLLESSEPESRGVLTGKIFEYISAGRPIICVGSRPDFEIGQLLLRTGTGVVVNQDDPGWVARTIRDRLNGGLPEWFVPNLNEIGRYTRKAQALELLAAMTNDGEVAFDM